MPVAEHLRGGDPEAALPERSTSGVSWGAIFAGSVVATAATLLLLALAAGLDLASVSPWPSKGASTTTFTVMSAIALIVIQWVAAGVGGYLAGRLRTRWVGTHTHEVFFRDTAHGFISWALSTLLVIAGLAAATTGLAEGGARVAGAGASGIAAGSAAEVTSAPVSPYMLDVLFRTDRSGSSSSNSSADARAQAERILIQGLANGTLADADRAFLAQLVSAQTGLSGADAQQRVDAAIAQSKAAEDKIREDADKARKAFATASIFTALSMLIGAFISCVSATLGGRLRDVHP